MDDRIGWLAAASLCLGACLPATALQLSSPEVADGGTLPKGQVYAGYGCTGDNLSPALSWSEAPEGTRSFAVTVFDPDAPSGNGWWHWAVYNLPASVAALPRGVGHAGALPDGAVQASNDFGAREFGGACPPTGDKPHRYVFTVYALKVEKLDVPPEAGATAVGRAIEANQIAKASITAHYGR